MTYFLSGFRFIKLSSGILQIINVQEGDTGSYRCHATQGSLHELPDEVDNIYRKTSAEASLEVFKGNTVLTNLFWQVIYFREKEKFAKKYIAVKMSI